jgi:hypothetical protein
VNSLVTPPSQAQPGNRIATAATVEDEINASEKESDVLVGEDDISG